MESTWSAVELVDAPMTVTPATPAGVDILAPTVASAQPVGEMLAPAAAAALPDVDALLAVAAENAAASPPVEEVPGGAALGTPRPSPVALETDDYAPDGQMFKKQALVKNAGGGSLLTKGHDPCAPALTLLRHALEFEPAARQTTRVCYPLKGGKCQDDSAFDTFRVDHPAVLPVSFQLNRLANEWERFHENRMKPFAPDGVHPTAGFARYLIEAALAAVARRMPEWFREPGPGSALAVVVADG